MRKNKKEINTKSRVYALNDAKGVTLMTLVVTIIVLLILGSIVTYSGIEAMNNTKRTKFVTELKIMQSYVNKWYEEWKNDNPSNPPGVNLGHTDEDSFRRSIRIHFWNDEKEITSVEGKSDYRTRLVDLNISNFSDYYFISREKIKSFGIEEVSQDLLVSVIDRKVISYEGLKDNGKMYYTIDSLEGVKGFDTIYNVEYQNQNTGNANFTVDYNYIGQGKTRVTVSNINYDGDNQKWKVKYRVGNGNWNISDNLSFIVSEYGQYHIGLFNSFVSDNIVGEKTITINMKVPQVGDTINYEPNGTYTWDRVLATTDHTGTLILSSASGQTYNVTQWKVLNYDTSNDTAEMVPTAPVGGLRMLGAQAYNNAVYLLDNACSSLYSNSDKGITARSIKEEDFVKAGKQSQEGDNETTNDWTRYRANFTNTNVTKADGTKVKYGEQKDGAYTSGYYPSLYVNEYGSIVNGIKNTDSNALRASQQTNPVGRKDPNNTATSGYIQVGEDGIKPYQTYYNTSNYTTTSGLLANGKATVLFPSGKDTPVYWVSSRCLNLYGLSCGFGVYAVSSGHLNISSVFSSSLGANGPTYALFPVVSARLDTMQQNGANTWNINI